MKRTVGLFVPLALSIAVLAGVSEIAENLSPSKGGESDSAAVASDVDDTGWGG